MERGFIYDENGRKIRNDKGIKRNSYHSTLPPKFKSYVSRCNSRGIEFELSLEEFNMFLKGMCIYCGQAPADGIDREDSKNGYNITNCASCCYKCNLMKHTKSPQEFIDQIKRIITHLGLCHP